MTPFMALIIVVWSNGTPAMPHPQPSEIYREVFPDRQICEIALAEKLAMVRKTYRMPGLKQPTIISRCAPAGKSI